MAVSFEQFVKNAGGTVKDVQISGAPPPEVTPTKGYASRVGEELKSTFQGLQKTTERGAELMGEGRIIEGAAMSGLGAAGGFIRGALSPATAAIAPLIQKGIESSGVTDNEKIKSALSSLERWSQSHPDAAENLKNIVEIAGVTGVGKLGTIAAKEVASGVRTAQKVVTEAATDATKAVTTAAKSSEGLLGGVTRVPQRVATNIADKRATTKSIEALPTKAAQSAARDGVDIADVKDIYAIPASVKPDARQLADNIVRFAKRESDIDPIEAVGKPIVAKLKQFDSLREKIGGKLGAVSEKLGKVSAKELAPAVLGRLKEIPGLRGLTMNNKGILDFARTTLTTALTKTDRATIQKAFTEAIKSGEGSQKHQLRQEIFEVLGGKKKSLANITDTQEKALDAIRRGLSDVLESKNSSYKTLSGQYRKVIQPLADLRKMMNAFPDATDDILETSAGLLARRLTSTSLSQGKLRTILKNIDNATKTKGNLLETTENLQKIYNVLGKYYDIAPKTGFQGQVRAGVESAGGISEAILSTVRGLAGETSAVRQKAIENILREALK